MNRELKRLRRRAFYLLPRSELLYRLCQRYVGACDGEGDADMHTNGELRFLRGNLPRDREPVVFDVGAHIGQWAQAVLKHNPHAAVNCFEPCRSSFEQLLRRDFPDQVKRNNFGLSSARSVRQMAVFRLSHYNSLYPDNTRDLTPEAYEQVQLETLANYCKQHEIDYIDYVKIDTEGHELDVLQGAAPMLSQQRIRIVQFEYNSTYIAAGIYLRDVMAFVARFNYEVFKISRKGPIPVPKYERQLENFHFSNYVLVSRNGKEWHQD